MPRVIVGFTTGKDGELYRVRKAKGLELLIMNVKDFIIKAQFAMVGLLYGKYEIQNDQTKSKIQKAFDKGIIYILSKIAGIDFCNIISAGLNSVKIGETFDPYNNPERRIGATPFEKRKWKIQYKAFQIQTKIDEFNAVFGTDNGQDMRNGLKELILSINQDLDELRSEDTGLSNKDILKAFPEVSIVLNFINNQISRFASFVNLRNISKEEVKDVIKFIDATKTVAMQIQQLNTPTNLINAVDALTGGKLDSEIKELEEFISSRGEPIRFLKYLIKQANSLNSTAKSVLGYINLARTVMKLLLFLIKIFYILRLWITNTPIPALYVDTGTIAKLDDFKTAIDYRGIENFTNRLQQFEQLLREIAELATIIIAGATDMIQKLTLIKLNLESCNPDLAKEIDDVIKETKSNADQLQNFINQLEEADQKNDTTFGKYTIAIVTEELADEGIRLRRRYGIARDSNNYIVVQTTPTFASWDKIIINEVKFLLSSKGLVKSQVSALSPETTIAYENAVNFLGEDNAEFNIDALNNIDLEGLGDQSDLGIFLKNLPGGSALKKKVRKKIAKNNQNLTNNLKTVDPNNKYSNSINPPGS